MSEQLKLPGEDSSDSSGGESEGKDLALIYVVSSLSGLDDLGHLFVDLSCRIIKTAAIEGSVPPGSKLPTITVHTPITHSSPKTQPDITAEEIYEMNFNKVADADGLIVVGHGGGGFGGGQEITWGVALRIPMLFLRSKLDPLSRQIEGTPADITFETFESADDLDFIVRNFIQRRRGQLQRHAAARRDRALTFALAHATLHNRWGLLDEQGKQGVAATASLHQRRVEAIVGDIDVLASASTEEVTALSGALGIPTQALFLPEKAPNLTESELSALRQAASEYELSGEEAIDLQIRAQKELSKGGIRRLPFNSAQDWIEFRESTR